MNEQEYQLALIEAKQEALNWQEKYMAQQIGINDRNAEAEMSKSEKFRELLEREKYLQSQLDDCATAQSRMLRKAFKGLGLKVGCFGEMVDDRADIAIAKITDWSVEYCRYSGIFCETYEISFEDLFDAEVQE